MFFYITCSYSNIVSDDWQVSYPITLVKGKKYKISTEASTYSEEYPEKMSLYLGHNMHEADLADFKRLQEFIVMKEEEGKLTYTTYYTASENQTPNFAIQMHSDPDMFALTVHRVLIKEATEGSISGTILDNTSQKGLEQIKINLQNGNQTFEAVSDTEGKWRLEPLPEGVYELKDFKVGYATHTETIEINSEQQTQLQITLRKLNKVTLTGNVTDENQKAIAEAFVTLYQAEMD